MKTLEEIDKVLRKFDQARWKYETDFLYPHICKYMLKDIKDIIHYLLNVKFIISQDEEHAYDNLMFRRIDLICKKTELEHYYDYCVKYGWETGYTLRRIVNMGNEIMIIEWAMGIDDFDLGSSL